MVKKKIEELIEPVLLVEGIELVDLEYKKGKGKDLLRIFIDKEGGINLDDCSNVSNQISRLLDVEDIILNAYSLEVSSPGIERPLLKVSHFIRFIGKKIKIKLYKPINGSKNFIGNIKSVDGSVIKIDTNNDEEVAFNINELAKANLYFDFTD
jgi:ribosome maturation factor RimP